MSREWKPGDVARMEAGGIVFRAGSEWVRSDGRGYNDGYDAACEDAQ